MPYSRAEKSILVLLGRQGKASLAGRIAALGLSASLLAAAGGCVTAATADSAGDRGALAADIVARTRSQCGSTTSLTDGDLAGSGVYVVGAFPEPERGRVLAELPTAADVQDFIAKNEDLLRLPAYTLGTYCEGDASGCAGGGKVTCYLDVSRRVRDLAAAAELARACNQKSIAFLGKDGVQIIETEAGRPFGDGQPLVGASLSVCARARRVR